MTTPFAYKGKLLIISFYRRKESICKGGRLEKLQPEHIIHRKGENHDLVKRRDVIKGRD